MNSAKCLSWLIGISLGIGLLVVLNELQIPYYLFYPRTTQTILISPSYDYSLFLASSISVPWICALERRQYSVPVWLGIIAIWAISFILAAVTEPFAVMVLYVTVISSAVLRVLRSGARRSKLREILPSSLAIFGLIEWSALSYWVAAAFSPHNSFGLHSQELEANLTYFLYPASIPITLLLFSSWLWIPLISRFRRRSTYLLVRYRPSRQKIELRMIVAALDLFAIVALIVFFYAYLGGQAWIVGQDAYWRYIDPVNGLIGLAPAEALNTSSSHGFYVLSLYLLQLVTGFAPAAIVKYAPLVLAFCTGSAVLFAALRGGWSFQLALLTSICTLLWIPTTLGIYVDIQANWLALLCWMLFLMVYFGYGASSARTYFVLAVLSLVILLVHPWTWGVFMATLLLTSIGSRRSSWGKHSIRAFASAVALAIPLGGVAYSLSPSIRYDLTNTVQLYASGLINPTGLLSFGDALANMLYNLGPVLAPVLLLLCLVGAYALSQHRDMVATYLIAWAATWCLGSILMAPSGLNPTNPGLSETGLWRMLYISPLPFLLALGMEKCINLSKPQVSAASPTGILSRIVPILSILPSLVAGGALSLFLDANVRLLLVAVAMVGALVVVVRFANYRCVEALMVSVLILLLFDTAFRTLFPLVLDPHNIFSSVGTGTGTGR